MLSGIGTQTIETERLILRKFSYQDNDNMRKNWISDGRLQSLYGEPAYTTQEEAKQLLDKYISSYINPLYFRWAVIEKDNNECIGQIAYFLVDKNNMFAEIEYCIGADFQNKGFATEATKAVIEYGFEKINLHKIQISHKAINNSSRRVIEKCGFVFEGTLRDYFYNNGKFTDRLYYSILKSEFEQSDRA